MNILRSLLLTTIIALLLSSVVMAKDPNKAANSSWITLNGVVVTSSPEAFELYSGTGVITVEMDGSSWYSGTDFIREGDKVTVNGRVDDDLYETASIEADIVYVKDSDTYYYANSLDEEEKVSPTTMLHSDTGFKLKGTIAKTFGREFTINIGSKEVKIDTSNMLYNPLDNKGYQKLKAGDFVQVTGELNVDFFDKREIMADTVTTLIKDTTKRKKQ